MADTEEGFGLPSTPVDSEAKELQAEAKQDPQLGTTSKAPTSPQAAFTQQVRSGPQPPPPRPPHSFVPLSPFLPFFCVFPAVPAVVLLLSWAGTSYFRPHGKESSHLTVRTVGSFLLCCSLRHVWVLGGHAGKNQSECHREEPACARTGTHSPCLSVQMHMQMHTRIAAYLLCAYKCLCGFVYMFIHILNIETYM